MKKLFLIFLLFIGCSVAPVKHEFQNNITFGLPFEKVKSKVIEWLINNKFEVPYLPENSDLVFTADGSIQELEGYKYDTWNGVSIQRQIADCGSEGVAKIPNIPQKAKINFVITKFTETATSVKINIQYYQITGDIYNLKTCYSNGILEKEIFDYINQ